MTRPFGQFFDCPHCHKRSTLESAFSRWCRNHDLLDSITEGVGVVDQDLFIHQHKTHSKREFECIMSVEIKVHGKSLTDAQKDTLSMINQIMRNRRDTPTKQCKHQAGNGPLKVYSPMKSRTVRVRSYGVHVLEFSGVGPDDSKRIRWDGKMIDTEILASLVRFDLDPDTLQPIDLRSHHIPRLISTPGPLWGDEG